MRNFTVIRSGGVTVAAGYECPDCKVISPGTRCSICGVDSTMEDGQPCSPTCLSHITHPCEQCGRIGGVRPVKANTTNAEEKTGAELAPVRNTHHFRVEKERFLTGSAPKGVESE